MRKSLPPARPQFMFRAAAPATPPAASTTPATELVFHKVITDGNLNVAPPTEPGLPGGAIIDDHTIVLSEYELRLKSMFFLTHGNDYAPEHVYCPQHGCSFQTFRNADGAPTIPLILSRSPDGHHTFVVGASGGHQPAPPRRTL